MITALDQQRPCWTPSRRFASTTHSHLGAKRIKNGTGSPASQPASRIGLRPKRSPAPPAIRLASALTTPKLMMKERMTVREASPNSRSARRGTTTRSSPTIAPTKALTTTSSANCPALGASPSRISGASGALGGAATVRPRRSARGGANFLANQVDGEAVGVLGRLAQHLGHGRVGVDRARQVLQVQVGSDRERALVDDLARLGADDVGSEHLVGGGVGHQLHEPGGLAIGDVAAVSAERE